MFNFNIFRKGVANTAPAPPAPKKPDYAYPDKSRWREQTRAGNYRREVLEALRVDMTTGTETWVPLRRWDGEVETRVVEIPADERGN